MVFAHTSANAFREYGQKKKEPLGYLASYSRGLDQSLAEAFGKGLGLEAELDWAFVVLLAIRRCMSELNDDDLQAFLDSAADVARQSVPTPVA
ncbi:hypothetical protein ACH4U6_01590 [Streptomyces netropsis]|uniref:hypothetical protein n=1 Tax=Streptomyces netropsis TaxID=55404 RepID=UPI00378D6235